MSWCRWSCDIDGKCNSDLYIYDHVDGNLVVHVAGRRRANYAENPFPEMKWESVEHHTDDWIREQVAISKARSDWFDANDVWENLPEEYAGKTYSFDYEYMDAFIEFLDKAREAGINFPNYIYDYASESDKSDEV